MNNKADLVVALLELGVRGRWLMVHSSYKAIAPLEGGPEAALEAMVEAVGRDGLLFIPAFNFHSWPDSHFFSKAYTPSEMGVITECARDDVRFTRTMHPIYSFSVWPKLIWVGKEPTNAFGACGIFGQFFRMNGILLNLGVKRKDENIPFPIIHFAENMAQAKHREYKSWAGEYISDQVTFRTYGMTVRKPGVITRVKPAMDELTEKGIVRELKICGADCQAAEAGPFVDGVVDICKRTPEKLFATEGK